MVAVAVGAYAAHGLEALLLKQQLPADDIAKRLSQCEVGARYHMSHALAILAVALLETRSRLATIAIFFWTLGIALFSGGLYSMVFLGKMGHWAIVPSGGLCFMIGWGTIIALGLARKRD